MTNTSQSIGGSKYITPVKSQGYPLPAADIKTNPWSSKTITQNLISTWRYAEKNYFIKTKQGTFVQDQGAREEEYNSKQHIIGQAWTDLKSVPAKITSEAQSYWLLNAAYLSSEDIENKQKYQDAFDEILDGVQAMIDLRSSGNGVFPAWLASVYGPGDAEIENRQLTLDNGVYLRGVGSSSNSAADADLDIVKALILAQTLVEKGVWTANPKYEAMLRKMLPAAESKLLRERKLTNSLDGKTVLTLNSSEQQNELNTDSWFIDYHDPGTAMLISDFIDRHRNYVPDPNASVAKWQKAAFDFQQVLVSSIESTGQFPAKAIFTPDTSKSSGFKIGVQALQSYDGIRGFWRLASGLKDQRLFANLTPANLAMLKDHLQTWFLDYNPAEIIDPDFKVAMVLPLAIALNDSSMVKDLWSWLNDMFSAPEISNGGVLYTDPTKYFQLSLIMRAILESRQLSSANEVDFKIALDRRPVINSERVNELVSNYHDLFAGQSVGDAIATSFHGRDRNGRPIQDKTEYLQKDLYKIPTKDRYDLLHELISAIKRKDQPLTTSQANYSFARKHGLGDLERMQIWLAFLETAIQLGNSAGILEALTAIDPNSNEQLEFSYEDLGQETRVTLSDIPPDFRAYIEGAPNIFQLDGNTLVLRGRMLPVQQTSLKSKLTNLSDQDLIDKLFWDSKKTIPATKIFLNELLSGEGFLRFVTVIEDLPANLRTDSVLNLVSRIAKAYPPASHPMENLSLRYIMATWEAPQNNDTAEGLVQAIKASSPSRSRYIGWGDLVSGYSDDQKIQERTSRLSIKGNPALDQFCKTHSEFYSYDDGVLIVKRNSTRQNLITPEEYAELRECYPNDAHALGELEEFFLRANQFQNVQKAEIKYDAQRKAYDLWVDGKSPYPAQEYSELDYQINAYVQSGRLRKMEQTNNILLHNHYETRIQEHWREKEITDTLRVRDFAKARLLAQDTVDKEYLLVKIDLAEYRWTENPKILASLQSQLDKFEAKSEVENCIKPEAVKTRSRDVLLMIDIAKEILKVKPEQKYNNIVSAYIEKLSSVITREEWIKNAAELAKMDLGFMAYDNTLEAGEQEARWLELQDPNAAFQTAWAKYHKVVFPYLTDPTASSLSSAINGHKLMTPEEVSGLFLQIRKDRLLMRYSEAREALEVLFSNKDNLKPDEIEQLLEISLDVYMDAAKYDKDKAKRKEFLKLTMQAAKMVIDRYKPDESIVARRRIIHAYQTMGEALRWNGEEEKARTSIKQAVDMLGPLNTSTRESDKRLVFNVRNTYASLSQLLGYLELASVEYSALLKNAPSKYDSLDLYLALGDIALEEEEEQEANNLFTKEQYEWETLNEDDNFSQWGPIVEIKYSLLKDKATMGKVTVLQQEEKYSEALNLLEAQYGEADHASDLEISLSPRITNDFKLTRLRYLVIKGSLQIQKAEESNDSTLENAGLILFDEAYDLAKELAERPGISRLEIDLLLDTLENGRIGALGSAVWRLLGKAKFSEAEKHWLNLKNKKMLTNRWSNPLVKDIARIQIGLTLYDAWPAVAPEKKLGVLKLIDEAERIAGKPIATDLTISNKQRARLVVAMAGSLQSIGYNDKALSLLDKLPWNLLRPKERAGASGIVVAAYADKGEPKSVVKALSILKGLVSENILPEKVKVILEKTSPTKWQNKINSAALGQSLHDAKFQRGYIFSLISALNKLPQDIPAESLVPLQTLHERLKVQELAEVKPRERALKQLYANNATTQISTFILGKSISGETYESVEVQTQKLQALWARWVNTLNPNMPYRIDFAEKLARGLLALAEKNYSNISLGDKTLTGKEAVKLAFSLMQLALGEELFFPESLSEVDQQLAIKLTNLSIVDQPSLNALQILRNNLALKVGIHVLVIQADAPKQGRIPVASEQRDLQNLKTLIANIDSSLKQKLTQQQAKAYGEKLLPYINKPLPTDARRTLVSSLFNLLRYSISNMSSAEAEIFVRSALLTSTNKPAYKRLRESAEAYKNNPLTIGKIKISYDQLQNWIVKGKLMSESFENQVKYWE